MHRNTTFTKLNPFLFLFYTFRVISCVNPLHNRHPMSKTCSGTDYTKSCTKILDWYIGGWSPTGSNWHYAHQCPIVPASDDYDDGEIGGMIDRGNRSTRRKPCPIAALSTTKPISCPEANPGRRGGEPATNLVWRYTVIVYSLHKPDATLQNRHNALRHLTTDNHICFS
jgi:hypothetical protein